MYTLKRKGTFFAKPLGCCHCGPDHEPREYEYEYSITVYNRSLDPQGFILDNLKPQAWFDSLQDGFSESCELLARRAAYQFAVWCIKPYKITVCIVGFETAAAEFTFYCESLPLRLWGLLIDYLQTQFRKGRE